ncbi:MAG: DUF4293 domain-containing protein [Bacteroidales bacterium]|nr:DUF4293 domain-containing protein [Bacteroidales bacterium]
MIQRIQTVYLLVATILISLYFFFPFASFILEQDMSVYHLSIKGLIPDAGCQKVLVRVIPLIFIISVIIAVYISSILLFKRRMVQIKLCILNIILIIGFECCLYYFTRVSAQLLGSKTSYSIIFIFPVISAILTYMAIRGIAKDEALVRSVDRLR